MQITSLLDIVDGRLLNQPSISFIYSIKTSPIKVKEGDLFIVQDDKDIELALKNGAFALIVNKDVEILDNEIAWIKVNSLEGTIIKLIRYLLSNLEVTAFYCNNASYELFKILKKSNTHKNIKLVPTKISNFFKLIDDLEKNDTLICLGKELLDNIYPINFNFNTKEYEVKNLIEHSIFETTFSYEDKYFSKLKISNLYINDFLDVFSFLNFDADLNKLKNFYHLKPIFVDKLINPIDFGKSDKFLIAQKNSDLVLKEINYLEKKYKYGKILYLTTKNIGDFAKNIDYFLINSLEELKFYLKKTEFNAIYFIGVTYDELYKHLSKQQITPSLI